MGWGANDTPVEAPTTPEKKGGGYGSGDTPDKPVVAPLPSSPGRFALETAANVPKSAGNVLKETVEGFIPSAEKAKNLTALVSGLPALESPKEMVKTTLPNGQTVWKPQEKFELPSDKEAREKKAAVPKALGDYFAARWGSMDGFLRALHDDPVAIAMDLGTVASMGGGALGKLPGFVGDAGEIIKSAGKKVDPVNLADKTAAGVAKVGEVGGAELLGHLTGAGPESVRQSVKAGFKKETAFIEAITGKMPMEEVVKWASGAIANMRKERGEQYRLLRETTIDSDPKTLSFDKIKKSISHAEEIGTYEGIPRDVPTNQVHSDVVGLIESWEKLPKDKFHSAEGLDFLKQKLGSILNDIPYERRSDRLYVGKIKSAVTQTITDEFPQYAKLMKEYHQASDALEEIEKAMSLGDKASYDTGIRKLQSAMRNNANTNYGNRLKMVDALEKAGAQGLKSALAGSQMSSAFPRGLAGRNPALTGLASLVHPGALAALPFESPYLVGRGGYEVGKLGGTVKGALDAAGMSKPAEAALTNRQGIARGGYYTDLANRVIGEEQ